MHATAPAHRTEHEGRGDSSGDRQGSVDRYLQDIGGVDRLTAAQEIEYAHRLGGLSTALRTALETLGTVGHTAAIARMPLVARLAQGLKHWRDAFVTANLGLVIHIAKRYERMHLAFADLIQEGNAGLIKAVDRFDPTRGVRFSTYAVWWIRHAIGRALSDKGREIRLPVHVAERLQTLLRTRRAFEMRHGRPAELGELAEATGWTERRVASLLASNYVRAAGASGNAPGEDRDTSGLLLGVDELVQAGEPPDARIDADRNHQRLHAALSQLTPIQRDVLCRRYGLDDQEPMTLREVGHIHDLSRERIRQVQERALAGLRVEFSRLRLVG